MERHFSVDDRELEIQHDIRKKARGFQWAGNLVFVAVLAITLDPTNNVDLSKEFGQVGTEYIEAARNVVIIGAVSVSLALEYIKYEAKKKIREILRLSKV